MHAADRRTDGGADRPRAVGDDVERGGAAVGYASPLSAVAESPAVAGPETRNLFDHPVMACQFCPGLLSTVVAVTEVPFMVQITGVPLVFWNRMSALPSPL